MFDEERIYVMDTLFKKILILGGKPIGSKEITETAKNKGLYTIVADYLPKDESIAKSISEEHWEVSTSDIDTLKRMCKEEEVSAVVTGVHEFNIGKKIELCEELGFPQYCTKAQWDLCENKAKFKKMCQKHGISVAKTYSNGDKNIAYPVIVKPVDSSGSRGFSICNNANELRNGIELALQFSKSKEYLIEEYMQCEACIIHYTAVNGELYFSGMSDKHSQRLEGGSSVMALQIFPSASMNYYLETVNEKAIAMFKSMGVQNGPIWIEAFNDEKNERFVFNEMGYRFGGSMTNYPVKHFYGIDQLDLMISNALGEKIDISFIEKYVPKTSYYCILPIHLKAGCIETIIGVKEAEEVSGVEKLVLVHHKGDKIENWGTAQNVFCYLHISYNTPEELAKSISEVKEIVSVKDKNDNELLFFLFDLEKLGVEI